MGDFHGLPVETFEGGRLQVDVLAEAGPRVVRLRVDGGPNLLAELPNKSWQTPTGEFFIRGGHRLWHSPEQFPRSYQPDNAGLALERLPDGARLVGPVEPATGIQKVITVRLGPGPDQLQIDHELHNHGAWPIELAPWAITMLRLGGMAVLPLGGPTGAGGLLPDRLLALWPYARWGDERLELHDDFLLVRGQAGGSPTKVGAFGRLGWAAYLLDGLALVKRFTPAPGQPHPDGGCNLEVYTDQGCLELETLGPLVRLEPGAAAQHREDWQILDAPQPLGVAAARALAARL